MFQLQARSIQIRDESRMFIETCKMNIQKARLLCDDAARLRDEAMILKEECIADKCKSLAILKISIQYNTLLGGGCVQFSSIEDDTSTLLQMIEEIKVDSISDEHPLHKLKSELLALSFLPASP